MVIGRLLHDMGILYVVLRMVAPIEERRHDVGDCGRRLGGGCFAKE